MLPRLVVGAAQPGGAGRPGEQVEIVGRLGEGGDGEAQRLVGRPDVEVVDHSVAGELDHLVVAARHRQRGGRDQRGRCPSTRRNTSRVRSWSRRRSRPSSWSSTASRTSSWRKLNPSSSSSTQQATLDEAAQVVDQLVLGTVAELRQHVEGRPRPEDRGRLDHSSLFGGQSVELPADQLGEGPRQRLFGERFGRGRRRRRRGSPRGRTGCRQCDCAMRRRPPCRAAGRRRRRRTPRPRDGRVVRDELGGRRGDAPGAPPSRPQGAVRSTRPADTWRPGSARGAVSPPVARTPRRCPNPPNASPRRSPAIVLRRGAP